MNPTGNSTPSANDPIGGCPPSVPVSSPKPSPLPVKLDRNNNGSSSPSLSGKVIVKKKDEKTPASPLVEKKDNTNISNSFSNFFYGLGKNIISFGSKVAIDLTVGDQGNSHELIKKLRQDLVELNGNVMLSEVIVAMCPKFADNIFKALLKSLNNEDKKDVTKDGLRKTLLEREALVKNIMDVTALNLMMNLAKKAYQEKKSSIEGNEKISITFSDLISCLLDSTENTLQELHQNIDQIEKLKGDEKKIALNKLFQPLLETLLPNKQEDIILPNGTLADNARGLLYNYLVDVLPGIAVNLYHSVMDPTLQNRESDESALKKFPGGDILNAIGDVVAKKIPEKVPGLLAANIESLVKEWSSHLFVVRNAVDSKSEAGEIEELQQEKVDLFAGWLGTNLKELVSNDDNLSMKNLWKFSESYLGPIIKHVFLKLAQYSKRENSENIVNDIIQKLLSTVTQFVEERHEILSDGIKKLNVGSEEERKLKEEHALGLFTPLTDEILKMTGLDKPAELPIPTFFQEMVSQIAKEKIPQRLLKLYQDLSPAEGSEIKEEHQKFAEFANIIIKNIVPNLLEKAQAQVPDLIATSITESLKNQALDAHQAQNLFKQVVDNLLTDPAAIAVGDYLRNQVQDLLTKILINLATIKVPSSHSIENPLSHELFRNLIVQIVQLSKKYGEKINFETRQRIQDLRKLPPAQQEKARAELIQQFIPFAEEILKLAGFSSPQTIPGPTELRNTLYGMLKDSLLPGFLLDTYQGFNSTNLEGFSLHQDFLPEELRPLKLACHSLSEKLISQLKRTAAHQGTDLVQFVNSKLLPDANLSTALQTWLSEEIKIIGSSPSPALKDGFQFIQDHVEKILFNALGALAQQYNEEHPEELDKEGQDVLRLATLQMVHLVMSGVDQIDQGLLQEIKKLQLMKSEEDRSKKLKELAERFKPLSLHILKGVGLKNAQDLALPSYLQEAVWEKIASLLPESIVNLIANADPFVPQKVENVPEIPNVDRLQSTVETLAINSVPFIQKTIENNEQQLALDISSALNQILPGFIETPTIQFLLKDIKDAKNPDIQSLLNKIPLALKELILPILINLGRGEESEGDVLEISLTRFLSSLSEQFKNRENIEAQLSGYENLSPAGKEHRLGEIFGPFVETTLNAAGLNYDLIPPFAKKQIFNQVYRLYLSFKMPLDIQQDSRLMLRQLMGVQIPQSREEVLKFAESLKEDFNPIEEFMDFASDKIQQQIKSYLDSQAKQIPVWINNLLPIQKLSEADSTWLGEALHHIVTSEDPSMENLWSYAGEVIQTALMKLFLDVAKSSTQGNDRVIPSVLKRITEIAGIHLEGIQTQINAINQSFDSPEERKLETQKLFQPISKALIELIGPQTLSALPIPESLKDKLLEDLKDKILPNLLSEIYRDFTSWDRETQNDQEHLISLFKNADIETKNPLVAAKIISRFVKDILPSILTNPDKKLDQKLIKAFSNFILKQSDKRLQAIHEYITNHPQQMAEFINENLKELSAPNGALDLMASTIENTLEVALLRSMNQVLSKIHRIQETQPEFFVNVGLNLLKMANQHFGEINRIMKKEKKSLAYKVEPKKFLGEFKDLHSSLASDPSLSQEDKDKLLMNEFLVPFSTEVLKLAGISTADDLSIIPGLAPDLREKVLDLLKTELGPIVFKELMDTINLDKIVLSVLELVNSSDAESEVAETYQDETQKQLNEECGQLLLNLLQLIPNPATNKILKNERLKTLSAQTIGNMVRKKLLNLNIFELVDKGFVSGLQTLDKRIKVENGQLVMPDDLTFAFAKTPEERQAHKNAKAAEAIELKKKMEKELTKTLRQQIVSQVKSFFSTRWKNMQDKIDRSIEAKFGKNATKVKAFLDKVFRVLVFTIIATALQILFYPIILLSELILNAYLKRKSHQISETLRLDIHKNLVFKCAEELVQAMNEASTTG